ncbi:MAG: LTA synthase family protein [Ruminococcus sp.]|nr:LTA synthase family protein [Ruminococcus sp.]
MKPVTDENKEKASQLQQTEPEQTSIYIKEDKKSKRKSKKKGKEENTEATAAENIDDIEKKADKKRIPFITSFCELVVNNSLFITFVLSLVINSLILRCFTVGLGDSSNVFKAIVKPMLADIVAVVIIATFGFLFRKQRSRFVYLMVWTVVFSILAMGNSIYYTNYKSFLSVSLLSTASQLGGVIDAVTENILEAKDFILLWPIAAMIVIYLLVKHKHEKGYMKQKQPRTRLAKYAGSALGVALVCGALFFTMVTSTDLSRLVKQWNRESVMSSFGMYVYQISDTISSLKAKINVLIDADEGMKTFDEFYETKDENDVVTEDADEDANEYTNIFEGKNVLVIHAESIQQFTMDTYINGEELTPNLNKLASEGLYFSNFYAQESVGTSSDTEFTFSTSLMPASSGTVAINYWDRDYASIQKAFKNMGYYVFSMHANNGSYWNRLNLHESLGYDRLYNYTTDYDIDEVIGLGLSDKSFFAQSVPMIKQIAEENESFYGTLIMLTNHTPFTDIENVEDYSFDVDFKYKVYNEETGLYEEVSDSFLEGTKLGSYFKSVHYADEALGQLMDDLDEEGLLDNTVVVIYGDHDAKIKEEQYEYYYNYNPFTGETLTEDDDGYIPVDEFYYNINHKVPLIIWSKDGGYEPTEITKVMGMYDVQPTLGNMFGFTNEYALGHDIFSIAEDEENIVIFPNGNYVTDTVYYNSQTDTYFDLTGYDNVAKYASCNQVYKDDPIPTYSDTDEGLFKFEESEYSQANVDARIDNGVVDEEYIQDRLEYASERIDVSNSIIYYDIINKVEEGFDTEIPATDNESDTELFSPPDAITRKKEFAA